MLGIGTFVLWTLIQLFGPNPPIVVSEETTVITSPLRADGLPDYQKYWRDIGREGVTPENNGAALFWQAIWPGELGQQDWQPMCDALGMKTPNAGESLQDPHGNLMRQLIAFWLTEQYQAELSDTAANELLSEDVQKTIRGVTADAVISAAQTRPWKSEQVPPLAEWIARNEKPLEMLTEASERPKWWSPSPSTLRDHYEGGIAMLLPGVQSLRGVARAFCIRAMWHAGEGRREAAWDDLKTCFRLARVTAKGVTLVEQLVAIAIDNMALKQTVALLQHGEPDAKFARQVLDDLAALKVPSDVMRSFNLGERVFFADIVVLFTENSSAFDDLGIDNSTIQILNLMNHVRIDWNHVLREGNHWYDRLLEAGKNSTYQERRIAFTEINSDLSQLGSNAMDPGRLAASFLSTSARSAVLADAFVSMMLPALEASMKAEDRAVVMLDLTRVAAALAVYRAEQGEYPEKLDKLVPDVLAKIPVDLYSGNPLHYERKADGGYLLYSVYENGTDEGGTNGDDIWAGEWLTTERFGSTELMDLVIRVPVPEFKMPPAPVGVE